MQPRTINCMGDTLQQHALLSEIRQVLHENTTRDCFECDTTQSGMRRGRPVDRHTKKLLFYLFAGTRGGLTRLRIIMKLLERQRNANQLACDLELDYKAIGHHMKVLERNSMVVKLGDDAAYGSLYRISDLLETNLDLLDEAITKLSYNLERKNRKKVYY